MQADGKNSEFMPKVDLIRDKDKLKYSHLIYMKQAEEIAVSKAQMYKTRRNKCVISGVCLGGIALGIYFYTIYAMKQETFLNNLEEPEKIIVKQPTSKSNIA
ncbi:PREDICTED: cytochrome c oxidase assembly factor 3, mitochondrial [Eufriesea mexicana]|uniref:cytochrome c oxidase assembly factor 3, mitochondrial n=1 Tax=Eufriesea mexicana TaxID=516756 RepID=UPI00083C29C9|nr:PREDICTED: cytochrome c oxidase assembly factor 3, mitochondrial [Eufriesea mexicana]